MVKSALKVKEAFSKLGPMSSVVLFTLTGLITFALSRILLTIIHFEGVSREPAYYKIFILGPRMDFILISYISMLPMVLLLLFPKVVINRFLHHFLAGYFSLFVTIFVFMEFSTIPFMDEFGGRPDNKFVEYLKHVVEVSAMLWSAYRWQLFCLPPLLGGTLYLTFKTFKNFLESFTPHRWWVRLLTFPLMAALLFIGSRSSFSHRPANISTASFSNQFLVNELTLNSSYTLFYTLYRESYEKDPANLYGDMPEEEVLSRTRKNSQIPESDYLPSPIPFLHQQISPFASPTPPNVVIILLESFGAEFVGKLGGLPLTPYMDKLAEKGLWFTNLYATGTRTVRGIEATVAGFLPTPGTSVVKLNLAKRDFFTAAQLFKRHHYETEFIYGGESNFDEMKSFFLGNGFQKIYDQPTFHNPTSLGVWGVSDEDLFTKADEIFKAHNPQKPFFSLILSTSNHSPFDFPEGRIDLYEQPKATQLNAMKYTDYALGEFFKKAKQSPYYKNTIFLIVADHNTRVHGDSLVPIKKFRIPGLILGPHVPQKQIASLTSQIDLLPTILHFTGLKVQHPMIGHNKMALPDSFPGRSFMQYETHHAYRVGDEVIIMRPYTEAKQFRVKDFELIPMDLNQELYKDAMAHALLPWILYRKQLYKLPNEG